MAYQFSKITVLVVDSQPAMVELIEGVLHILGVQNVITRTDGKSGIEAFHEYTPDLLIVDWDLESINGLEFTKTIRTSKKAPFVPIIFMTAFSSKKRVLQARDSGITEFMAKPFSAHSLYKRIEEVIERPRKFVRSETFFGPDRRRRQVEGFKGDSKRSEDSAIEIDLRDAPLETNTDN